MRQAAGELANRLHLLRLAKLLFDATLFGDVAADTRQPSSAGFRRERP